MKIFKLKIYGTSKNKARKTFDFNNIKYNIFIIKYKYIYNADK